jgi:hypothetical protein
VLQVAASFAPGFSNPMGAMDTTTNEVDMDFDNFHTDIVPFPDPVQPSASGSLFQVSAPTLPSPIPAVPVAPTVTKDTLSPALAHVAERLHESGDSVYLETLLRILSLPDQVLVEVGGQQWCAGLPFAAY